jgi:hypothetical protein
MLTDDAVIDLLKESFDEDTRGVAASPQLPTLVRSRLRRRRAGRVVAFATPALAAASVVAVAALGGQPSSDPGGTAIKQGGPVGVHGHVGGAVQTVRLSSFHFTVPADTTVTKTCLPDSDAYATSSVLGEVFELVPDGHGGLLSTAAGNPCVGATFRFTEHPPAAVDQVATPGQPTVYLTASTPGTRAGYVMLTGRDAAAAAAAVDGQPGSYAVVMTIPDDNDQAVLIAGLRQYHPGG